MARQQSSGPGLGLILTLIFFILATFICGTLAYFGYSEQDKLVADAKAAKKEKDQTQIRLEEEQARKLVLRSAMGLMEGDDEKDLSALMKSRAPAVQDEHKRLMGITKNLPNGAQDFSWPLEGENAKPAPSRTIPDVVASYVEAAKKAADSATAEKQARIAADQARQNAVAAAKKERDKFDAELAKKTAELAKINQAKSEALDKAVADLKKIGLDLQAITRSKGELEETKNKELVALHKKITELTNKVSKFEGERKGPDLVDLDRPKGKVDRKEESYVYIDLGSAHNLRPGVTFSVLPKDAVGRGAANMQRKGAIEVIEILSPYSAQAKILEEADPIRNPIRPGDLLFNPVWTPGVREHVAIAGIIDLNGDGKDDNIEFIRQLEKMGVAVDSYLDLRDRQIKGPGMTLKTGYLVLGDDPKFDVGLGRGNDPRSEVKKDILTQMSAMKAQAKELGVQSIDARKFLLLIGLKMPRNPLPSDYDNPEYLKTRVPGKDENPPKKDEGR